VSELENVSPASELENFSLSCLNWKIVFELEILVRCLNCKIKSGV